MAKRVQDVRPPRSAEAQAWMKENEWGSLAEMRGNMAFDRVPDPAAFEREQFRIMQ